MSNETVNAYVRMYFRYAVEGQMRTGVPAIFSLAQGALESLWGKSIKGNNVFGIKDTDGVNGNEQLMGTTEYHSTPNVKYPVIRKIVQVAPKRWRYSILDYFRKYVTPAASFEDHGNFLRRNKRYAKAFLHTDPRLFAKEVAAAGYATDPQYYEKLVTVIGMIERSLSEQDNLRGRLVGG